MTVQLPTVEQVHAFMDAINRGRAVYGLDAIDKLDYDACEPGMPHNCLSATHLAVQAGGCSLSWTFDGVSRSHELARALGTEIDGAHCVVIPDEILAVTDPYDALMDQNPAEMQAFRDRLVEAGVVD